MNQIKKIVRIFHAYRRLLQKIILHLVYGGFGISSVIGKVMGKKFLDMQPHNSTWVRHESNKDFDSMY